MDISKISINEIDNIIKKHHEFFKDSIPLIASENLTSVAVRRCYVSDFGHRYAEGKVGERFYQGCKYVDDIEGAAIQLTKKLFGVEHANVQPISGVVANIAAFFALTKPGDNIVSISVPAGGHISHDRFSAAGIRGLKVSHYPYDAEKLEIDIDATRKMVLGMEPKPRLFILGSSLILFPQPVREISELAQEIGASLMYDASHVLGLIAGKKFQDPMKEGADLLTGSTHKTFFGPQRAIILSKPELAKKVDYSVFPGVLSNHHINTLTGYVISVLEMMEFGQQYASQIVKNAKRLGEKMHELGFSVLGADRGFTESHQIAIDVTEFGGGDPVANKLERINIILNKNLLPYDDINSSGNPSGIRIGVQEITRVGMKEEDMDILADIIWKAVKDIKSEKDLKEEVIEFKKNYQTIKYTFEESPAYAVLNVH